MNAMPGNSSERRALGRQMAVDGLVRAALARSGAAERSRPVHGSAWPGPGWSWRKRLATAAAAVAAAAGGLLALWLHGEAGGFTVESGHVYEGGRPVGTLAAGRRYQAGELGAKLAAPGGGRLGLSGGTSFTPTALGVEIERGEVFGHRVAKAEFRAGPIRAEASGASLALMRLAESGADEAAVVVLSGRVRADCGGGHCALAAGQVLAWGWGVKPGPLAIADLQAALAAQRRALAPAGEAAKYRGIVGEYAERLAGFRREMQDLAAGSPEAEWLQSRIGSLADCQAAHQRRLPALDADAAEGARIARRAAFLDRAVRAGREDSLTAAFGPELPAGGGLLSSVPLSSGGQVRLSMLGR